MSTSNISNYKRGLKNGMPICLGYFAVSFAFGIKAASIGLTSGNATLLSLLNMTSAGQLAALDVIRQNGTYLEMMLLELVVNKREVTGQIVTAQ